MRLTPASRSLILEALREKLAREKDGGKVFGLVDMISRLENPSPGHPRTPTMANVSAAVYTKAMAEESAGPPLGT